MSRPADGPRTQYDARCRRCGSQDTFIYQGGPYEGLQRCLACGGLYAPRAV